MIDWFFSYSENHVLNLLSQSLVQWLKYYPRRGEVFPHLCWQPSLTVHKGHWNLLSLHLKKKTLENDIKFIWFKSTFFQFQVSVVCIPKFERHAYFYGQDQENKISMCSICLETERVSRTWSYIANANLLSILGNFLKS